MKLWSKQVLELHKFCLSMSNPNKTVQMGNKTKEKKRKNLEKRKPVKMNWDVSGKKPTQYLAKKSYTNCSWSYIVDLCVDNDLASTISFVIAVYMLKWGWM